MTSCVILDAEYNILGSASLHDVTWRMCVSGFENISTVKIIITRDGHAHQFGLSVPWRKDMVLGPVDLPRTALHPGQTVEFGPGDLRVIP